MLKIKKRFDAIITDCGLSENKDNQPQPFIKFEITDEAGGKHVLTWFGSMKSEKATEFAVKTLVSAGFMGNDFADLNKGVISFDRSIQLTVELEHPQKDGVDQTDKFKIKYINTKTSGLAKFQGTVPSQVALFSRIKSELGVKKTKPITTAQGEW